MYVRLPSFVLGFHGCDRAVGEDILAGRSQLRASDNNYDWLGPGVYFWENNPKRALSYAQNILANPRRGAGAIKEPFVLGAIIDLGYCLNLTDESALDLIANAHRELCELSAASGVELPHNKGGEDLLLRQLDCAVFRTLHGLRRRDDEQPFQTVRAPFLEGSPIYAGTPLRRETHIQISVLDTSCIKGYFRPLNADGRPLQGEAG